MSKRTRILVTIFGGWFGLHKFMDKKIGMGILYFLTAGLFGIGWIIDIIKECIAKPHDKNAVMVMLNHSLIGYIPREDAPFVCKLIASNSLLSAKVDILGGNVKTIRSNEDVVIEKNSFHVNLKYTYKK